MEIDPIQDELDYPIIKNKPKTLVYELTDETRYQLDKTISAAIQIRNILNDVGFKFLDDNKLSSITNEAPIPLGRMTCYYDYSKLATIYKQTL